MHLLQAIRTFYLADPVLAPPSGSLTGGLWHGRVGYDAAGNQLAPPFGHIHQLANPIESRDSLRRYIAKPQIRITVYAFDDDQANAIAEQVRDEFNGAKLFLGAGTGEAVMGLVLMTDVVIDIEPEKLDGLDVWSAYVEFFALLQRQRKYP